MAEKFYITTAIDYPNNPPHIGHAFEKIGADVQARYRRMQGCDTYFLIGNDENTVKVSKRAADLGRDTQQYVDEMADVFKNAWRQLEISNDDFIQTSEERHKIGCQKFIQRVYDAGYIYKKPYRALYCEGCEGFKTTKELSDGRCPNHPNLELRQLEEENYFFALSKFRDRLLKLYADRPDFIQPETRRNEIVSLVEKEGLDDISITRTHIDWGIRVPFDPEQTIYVWFDALLNYITGVGYGTDEAKFRRWWPAQMHVIGKDITRFHCALWPAMLMAAGVELPRRVQVHGFVMTRDESGQLAKMSKSLGNVVSPMDLYDRFGADAFRYFFMRECPFTGDGEFSYERFIAVYNSDLANNLGNLYSRTLTMCLRYFEGHLDSADGASGLAAGSPGAPGEPSHAQGSPSHADIFAGIDLPAVVREVQSRIESCEYNVALATMWQQILDPANRYIDRTEPFKLAKTDRAACQRVLINLAEALRIAAILTKPFLPAASARIYSGFNFAAPYDTARFEHASAPAPQPTGLRVTAELKDGKVPPLFPRIEMK
jgi:methionyl-tRNA synthetase